MDILKKKKSMKNILVNEKKLMNEQRRYRSVTFTDYNLDYDDQESVRLLTEQFVASKFPLLDKSNED